MDKHVWRQVGLKPQEIKQMLKELGCSSEEEFIRKCIPEKIITRDYSLPEPISEKELIDELKMIAEKNEKWRSFIGMGYYSTYMPYVIRRNVLENPAWYTPYTPYQAEISQGRLYMLFLFQTLVAELTDMEVSNASMLDEATSVAEAALMALRISASRGKKCKKVLISEDAFPQVVNVVKTIIEISEYELEIANIHKKNDFSEYAGVILPYPNRYGEVIDWTETIKKIKESGTLSIINVDPLMITIFKTPGEMNADIACGHLQRFGLPMGYGGPHPGFIATKKEYVKQLPGRIIGATRDAHGNLAYRMALQTREQHIRKEKATSNICTAQSLPAILATFYAIFHGKKGLQEIAKDIYKKTHLLASLINKKLSDSKMSMIPKVYFGTLSFAIKSEIDRKEDAPLKEIMQRAKTLKFNLWYEKHNIVILSIDELTNPNELEGLFYILTGDNIKISKEKISEIKIDIPDTLKRETSFLDYDEFNNYRSETALMRFIKKLASKDISLSDGMIPLGSCTMKLNPAVSLHGLTEPLFDLHPYVPKEQAQGYFYMIEKLLEYFCELTGLNAGTFQPQSGAMAEFTGLCIIKKFFASKKEARTIMLIPESAHGTNFASSAMAGFSIVKVPTLRNGTLDLSFIINEIASKKDKIAGIMITYPSTFGCFDPNISEIAKIIHEAGGLVYMDGANFNAMAGYVKPAAIGADIFHINLHKTFGIPHGGGGPGAAALMVKDFLAKFLPEHPCFGQWAISGSPHGNALLLTIAYSYLRLISSDIKIISLCALLNANYLKHLLSPYWKVAFENENNFNAHEFIISMKDISYTLNITPEDVAKRLIDFGIHAPTISFPLPNSFLIEPTESEDLKSLHRFAQALNLIYEEIMELKNYPEKIPNSSLKNAPHLLADVIKNTHKYPYPPEKIFYPFNWLNERRYFSPVARIDNVWGDKNLILTLSDLIKNIHIFKDAHKITV